MRGIFVIVACLMLAQCALPGQKRYRVGAAADAYVIIGVAEAGQNTSPNYTMLWRRLDANGAFMRFGGDRMFEARSESGDSVQIEGIPGEFTLARVEPGTYALDSVFALVRDGRVNYVANGLVRGPARPTFDVRPGEAVYLGIWQVNLEDTSATVRPWRLERGDLDAVIHDADPVDGSVRMLATTERAVTCTPFRLNTTSQRQVC